jgi:hypothetical protein
MWLIFIGNSDTGALAADTLTCLILEGTKTRFLAI